MSAGKRLREIRDLLDLTQAEFGDKLGFKWSKIKDLESDKLKITPEIALQIEKLFSVDFRWLLTGDGKMFSSHGHINESSPSYNSDISAVARLMSDLPESDQKYILQFCENQKLLRDLQKEKLKKSAG